MNSPKLIKTRDDYQNTLNAIDELLAISSPTQTQTDQLELLSILAEDYENKTMSIELPDPVEAIKFRMEQDGLSERLAEVPELSQQSL